MKIGIIGAGNIGGTLAKRLAKLGHDVSVANSRGPETLATLAAESGVKALRVEDVARGADVVIVTIPMKNVPKLQRGVLDEANPHAAVIDTCNYYPKQRDGLIAEIESGMPESRFVESHVGRPVVKVFNGISAKNLMERGVAKGTPGRMALPVAGDDEIAKRMVMDLVEELGFTAVDAGGLDESWRQQPGTPSYGAETDDAGLRRALADASLERTGEWRA